jgi:hypothetical protein
MNSVLSNVGTKVRVAAQRSRNRKEVIKNLRLLRSGLSRLLSIRDVRSMRSQAEAIKYTADKLVKSAKKLNLRPIAKVQLKGLRSLGQKMLIASKELPRESYRTPNRRPGRRYGPGRRFGRGR